MVQHISSQPNNEPVAGQIKQKDLILSSAQVPVANRYVASTFWSSLAGEVQALREILEDGHDSVEETSDMTSPSTTSLLSTSHPPQQPANSFDFILCHPGRIYEVPGALPELHTEMQTTLFEVYVEYVDPCWKVFHEPTLRAFMQEGRPYLGHDAIAPCNRALKAAIHFEGISQMLDKDCREKFGQARADLVTYFRRIADAAFVRADLLNTGSLAAIQAFTIYVVRNDAKHFGLSKPN